MLLRARLAGRRGTELPVTPLLTHAFIAGALAWIARDSLPPFGYGVYSLTVCAILVALPLLGEFSHLLRADPAQEWVGALPVSARDLRIARALHVAIMLAWLAMGSLLPVAALAPAEVTLVGRAALVLSGLGLVVTLGAGLLTAQVLLGRRAEAALVLLQTLMFTGAVVGFVLGGALFPELEAVSGLGDAGWTWWLPSAWFAAPLGENVGTLALALPWAALAVAAALFASLPTPRPLTPGRREPLMARLLRPARALATRLWVRRDERAIFDLVYDALPREREFVLRTYPMVGIPLAFVIAGSGGEASAARSDLLAVLLFTACIYLPVLLTYVPASESHQAEWLLKTHPVSPGAVAGGTIKAIAVRFLLPLYVALAALAWIEVGPHLVLRLAVPGLLISLLVLRAIYSTTVTGLPLSVSPDRIESNFDWGGVLVANGLALTVAAVLVNRLLPGLGQGALLTLGLVALELVAERGQRARLG